MLFFVLKQYGLRARAISAGVTSLDVAVFGFSVSFGLPPEHVLQRCRRLIGAMLSHPSQVHGLQSGGTQDNTIEDLEKKPEA